MVVFQFDADAAATLVYRLTQLTFITTTLAFLLRIGSLMLDVSGVCGGGVLLLV